MRKTLLQANLDLAQSENTVLCMAMNSLVNREVKYIRGKHSYRVGLCRLLESHGGVVVVTFLPKGQRPFSTAHYLEKWCSTTIEAFSFVHHSPEALALVELAYEVRKQRNAAMEVQA